jgi:hypothetical protein
MLRRVSWWEQTIAAATGGLIAGSALLAADHLRDRRTTRRALDDEDRARRRSDAERERTTLYELQDVLAEHFGASGMAAATRLRVSWGQAFTQTVDKNKRIPANVEATIIARSLDVAGHLRVLQSRCTDKRIVALVKLARDAWATLMRAEHITTDDLAALRQDVVPWLEQIDDRIREIVSDLEAR